MSLAGGRSSHQGAVGSGGVTVTLVSATRRGANATHHHNLRAPGGAERWREDARSAELDASRAGGRGRYTLESIARRVNVGYPVEGASTLAQPRVPPADPGFLRRIGWGLRKSLAFCP